jgi:hypothetical protein
MSSVAPSCRDLGSAHMHFRGYRLIVRPTLYTASFTVSTTLPWKDSMKSSSTSLDAPRRVITYAYRCPSSTLGWRSNVGHTNSTQGILIQPSRSIRATGFRTSRRRSGLPRNGGPTANSFRNERTKKTWNATLGQQAMELLSGAHLSVSDSINDHAVPRRCRNGFSAAAFSVVEKS